VAKVPRKIDQDEKIQHSKKRTPIYTITKLLNKHSNNKGDSSEKGVYE